MKRASLTVIAAFVALVFITVYQYVSFNDGLLHVVMCNVGQGEAIYIRTPTGSDILIDGGPDKSVLRCLNSHMPYYDRTIDTLILTNADLDHYGGFSEVLKNYTVKQFVTTAIGKNDIGFERLEEEVEKQKVKVNIMQENDLLRDNNILFTSVWPQKVESSLAHQTGRAVLGAYSVSPSVNVYSLVLKLRYGDFDMLLTGDIVPPATDEMSEVLCCHPELVSGSTQGDSGSRSGMTGGNVEVLKVPHHGSKNGLTQKLLEATRPGLAIISAGRKNKFGHPARETLKLLEDQKVKILRTDEVGDIEIVSDGKTYSIK